MTAPNPWTGVWRRSLLRLPDGGEDTATAVTWLQARSLYVDLRLGADDVDHAEGFAGRFLLDGARATWRRDIDLQPPGDTPDVGDLHLEGDVLVETGVHSPYVEHWHRESADNARLGSVEARLPGGGLLLGVRVGDRWGLAWRTATQTSVALLGGTDPDDLVVTAASQPALTGRRIAIRPDGITALGLVIETIIDTEGAWV